MANTLKPGSNEPGFFFAPACGRAFAIR